MKTHLLLWMVVLPFVGAAFNGLPLLLGKRFKQATSGYIAVTTLAITFGMSLVAYFKLQSIPATLPLLSLNLGTWIQAGSLQIDFAFAAGPLAGLLLLLLHGLGFLAHIHALGSMKYDPSAQRFYTYTALLMGFMTLLLTSNNFILFLLAWQAVSLLSSLLVGFWFQDAPKAEATTNTYVFQRIGDVCLLLGIFLLFWALYPELNAGESFTFQSIEEHLKLLRTTHWMGMPISEVVCVTFLVAAITRSAQFPLHVWLHDTTQAPVVASALLQTVVGVAGGIYLLAKMNVLYSVAPIASWLLAGVGVSTALFAATAALFQNDLRVILAYSTISQMGFVFLSFGVGSFSSGVFHLVTHSCTKMLLLLGAGNVMAQLQHENDIRKMGGLLQHSKATGFAFLIGSFALIGFPGFSGFFSLQKVLWKTFATHHTSFWVAGSIASILTAFYVVRMFCLAFLGNLRVTPNRHPLQGNASQLPESPKATTGPLWVLAGLAALLGLVGLPYFLTHRHPLLESWLAPLFVKGLSYHPQGAELMGAVRTHNHLAFSEGVSMGIGFLGMLLGAGAALSIYVGRTRTLNAIAMELSWEKPETGGFLGRGYRLLYQNLSLQRIYQTLFVRPIVQLSHYGLWPFDQVVLDGVYRGIASFTIWCSRMLHRLKSRGATWPLFLGLVQILWIGLWLLLRKLYP